MKWISFVANQGSSFEVFVCTEKSILIDEDNLLRLKENGIHFLPSIATFSISKPKQTIKSIKSLNSYIDDNKIDLVHVLFASPFALWLNFIKIPFVITTRGSDILIVIPSLLKEGSLKRLYFKALYLLFKRAFERAELVTSTSFAQLEKIESCFKTKALKLIRTGVDVEKIEKLNEALFLPKVLLGKSFILSPRFMSDIYDIELQINAIEYLSDTLLQANTFVFVKGKSFDSNYFNKQLESLNRLKESRNLDFLIFNYLSQEELWAVLKCANLCVMTPKSDGTPNSALEAMSAKCPLIIPKLNYDKELFENTCLVLQNRDPKELASLIEMGVYNYPIDLLESAFLKTKVNGNRTIEMEKLLGAYQQIFTLS